MSKRLTATRLDPACGTCRKKCRKCDRTRPVCKRCTLKGLHCEGYPPRFQFLQYGSTPSSASAPNGQTETVAEPASTRKRKQRAPAPNLQVNCATNPIHLPTRSRVRPSSASLPTPEQSLSPESDVSRDPSSLVDDVLATSQAQTLLVHFDTIVCDTLAITTPGTVNPFRAYVLPLSYQHTGILHALLGLAAYHLNSSGTDTSKTTTTAAIQHKLSAIQSLSTLLIKEEISGLSEREEEVTLAIVLLLVLQDVCESGISTHGAHLTGVTFLCGRIAERPPESRTPFKMFLVSCLAWLDGLRGFSGAEKLAYSDAVRQCILNDASWSLLTVVGCPPSLFYEIGKVLSAGRDYVAGTLSPAAFQPILDDSAAFLRSWDADNAPYPTPDPEWRLLAEAYRHACILRVLRFPEPMESEPPEDGRIRASVNAILDVAAKVPMDGPFFKRLLFPLFLAGADTSSPHQYHYAQLCIGEIKRSTGFQHQAMMQLLKKVWEVRLTNEEGWRNVPWMHWTCSSLLKVQHAFLFF